VINLAGRFLSSPYVRIIALPGIVYFYIIVTAGTESSHRHTIIPSPEVNDELNYARGTDTVRSFYYMADIWANLLVLKFG